MTKKILAGLLLLVAAVAVIGLLLPRNVRVSRSVLIDRPPSLVYASINSFQLFPRWSPWQDLDPHMQQTMDGAREGVGARLSWSGNKKVGSGTQLITASTPDKSVASDLEFGGMGVAKSLMTLQPEGNATRTTWTLDMDMGKSPVGHYFGLMMDKMIGGDFDSGLERLKALVEGMPNIDINGLSTEPVELKAQPLLIVTESAELDPAPAARAAAMAKAYTDAYSKIGAYMKKNNLKQSGAPLGIDGLITPTNYGFDAGIPIDRADVAGGDGVRLTMTYAGRCLKTIHVGAYDTLKQTREKLLAFVVAHGYTMKGPTFDVFVDDPGTTPPDRLRTEVYVPVG